MRYTRGGGKVVTAASLGVWTPTTADRFGAAVVATELNGDRCIDLVVGAPGRGGSGAVDVATENTVGMPGTAEAGDRFGSVLAAGRESSELLVGVPGEDIGATTDAGQLVTFDVGPEMSGTMASLTESSPLFHGYVEAGDRFGATLAAGRHSEFVGAFDHRHRVVVGIPGEDVHGAADAGAVVTERARVNRATVVPTPSGTRGAPCRGRRRRARPARW